MITLFRLEGDQVFVSTLYAFFSLSWFFLCVRSFHVLTILLLVMGMGGFIPQRRENIRPHLASLDMHPSTNVAKR